MGDMANTRTPRAPLPPKHHGDDPFLWVIGDSHASLFSGVDGLQPVWPEPSAAALPGVRSVRLGSRLAYSLTREGHAVRSEVRAALRQVPRNGAVVFAFGEIDCRCHVVPQASKSGRSIKAVAKILAGGYVKAAVELAGKKSVGFLAAPPPPSQDVIDPAFPTRGTFAERAAAAEAFNSELEFQAAKHGCKLVSFSHCLVDERGARREDMFQDLIHCRVSALPQACEALVKAELVPSDRERELMIAAAALSRVPWRPAATSIYMPPPIAPLLPARHESPTAIELALLDRAALECVWMGARRVAVYGAGMHTKRLGVDFLKRRGLEVTAVLDDRPSVQSLHGLPVIKPTSAAARYDAVVLSSDVHEDTMAARCSRIFTPRGIRVVRIYGWREPWPGVAFQQ